MEKQDKNCSNRPKSVDCQVQLMDEDIALLLPLLVSPLKWNQLRAVAQVLYRDGDWQARLLQLLNHAQTKLRNDPASPKH